jgi:hypothetical protein
MRRARKFVEPHPLTRLACLGGVKQTLIQYRVPIERAKENAAAAAAVFAELERVRPAGLRYTSWQLEDGVTFVHIVFVDAPDGTNPLSSLPSFQAFTAGVKQRCVEPPIFRELTVIGSYELFGRP